jgi:phosphoglycerate dehydrogenase-like enzyme
MIDPIGLEYLRKNCRQVVQLSGPLNDSIGEADALYAAPPGRVTGANMAAATRLRVISVSGAGVDRIDVDAASETGIAVLNVAGAGAGAVAEYVVGSLIAIARRFVELDRLVRNRGFDRGSRPVGIELRGRRLGIVGLGHVGREVARMASSGLGMTIATIAREGRSEPSCIDIEPDLESLLAASDCLCVSLPLTPATKGLIGAREIACMRPGVLLVNVSRGGIIDEQALAAALESGHVGAAAIDVFAAEPSSWRSPLASSPNCLMTPHIAGTTDRSRPSLALGAARNIVRALDGAWEGLTVVNPAVLSQ